MPFPDNEHELTRLVGVMRQLGVVQAFGVVLGPEPPKPAAPPAALDEDGLRLAKREARLAEARERVREQIGNWDLTDAQCDAFLQPGAIQ